MLTADDHKRIAQAIETVEQKTEGDVYCLVAHEASRYRETPLLWATLLALLLPPLVLTFVPAAAFVQIAQQWLEGWSAMQSQVAAREVAFALTLYSLIQAVLFALVALIVSLPAVTRSLTPGFLKHHRVRQLAQHHFVSTGLHLNVAQPHVLIFLALAERRVEIIASEAIHKVSGDKLWRDASAAVAAGMRQPDPTSGIVRAIELVGAALIANFPARAPRTPNHSEGMAEI